MSSLAPTKRLQQEDGAIMILALAFVTIVLALAVGLLGLAYTGSNALRAHQLERARRYSADAALNSAVQMAKGDTTLGRSTSPPACAMTYTVQEDTAHVGGRVFTAGSVINVSCAATPGVSNSGDVDVDGGQRIRDVTFTATCAYTPPVPTRGTLTCGSGSATLILGRARVRYDNDYGITPTLPDCGPIDPNFGNNLCTASTKRAVVPKIVYWSLGKG